MARTRGISLVVVFSVFLTLLGPAKPAAAAGPEVDYIYDELGRLRAVVDAASDAAIYSYDAAGNITSIDRHPATTVDVIEFTPNAGAVGDEVRAYGTGFDPTPANNSVTFGGTSATVSSATPTELVVEVPAGATTGAIAVSAPAGSSTSASDFVVVSGASPSISSVSAFIGVAGDSITIDGSGFETDPELNRVLFGYTPSGTRRRPMDPTR